MQNKTTDVQNNVQKNFGALNLGSGFWKGIIAYRFFAFIEKILRRKFLQRTGNPSKTGADSGDIH